MRTCLTILLLILLCGCAVGPDYQRPGYPEPSTFRGEGPGIPTQPAGASFGDLKWFEVFKDAKLQELIRIALQENYDVQIAAQRVLAAREQVTIQRSYLFPTVQCQQVSPRPPHLGAGIHRRATSHGPAGWRPLRRPLLGIGLLRPHPPGHGSGPG